MIRIENRRFLMVRSRGKASVRLHVTQTSNIARRTLTTG
jgi:hypothetical protein